MSRNNKVEIIPYIGFANSDSIYCFGRIIEAKKLRRSKWNKWWENLFNAYQRLESDEIAHQEFDYQIGAHLGSDITNSEGFYKLNEKVKSEILQNGVNEILLKLKNENADSSAQKGIILRPHTSSNIAVISDIDDTILETEVLRKWRVVYNSLFLHANQRKPVSKMNIWFQELAKQNASFYYLSNSPWNFYDNLSEFIAINNFPQGPILLRDFGWQKKDSIQEMSDHKKNEIEHLLEFYPTTQFILVGDGGEKDAFIYLDIKVRYPDRIKAIFIRRLGDKDHQAKIEEAMKGHEAYFYFTNDTNEAMAISRQML